MHSRVPPADAKASPSPKGRAHLLLALVTVLAMAATAGLGVWQLQRAAFKEALSSQIESQSKLAALQDLPAGDTQALVHRLVSLRGAWLHQHTVFLDNRFMGGRPGFIVATPLQIAASSHVVWVQRGWVPRDPLDRTRLPTLVVPAGLVTVPGRVVDEVSRVYALGASETASAAQTSGAQPSAPGPARDWRIVQNLPAVDFGSPTRLLPVAVLQTALSEGADAPDGLQRNWMPLDSGVSKHYGYAFQWFALCGLIMVLYAWFQFIAPRRRKL